MPRYVDVGLFSKPSTRLTYEVPDHLGPCDLRPGQRVIVPLGTGRRLGVVLGDGEPSPEKFQIKPLLWPVDLSPVFTPLQLELADNLSLRAMRAVGDVLTAFLPSKMRTLPERFELTHTREESRVVTLDDISSADAPRLRDYVRAWVEGRLSVPRARPRAEDLRIALLCAPPWPVRPNAVRQKSVLDMLWLHGGMSFERLRTLTGLGDFSVLQAMHKQRLIDIRKDNPTETEAEVRDDVRLVPTADQQVAISSLREGFDFHGQKQWLLHGVTGSGKTLVYAEVVRHCLERNGQALVLSPEVALAMQMVSALRTALPRSEVLLSHGYQAPKVREATYRRILTDNGPLVVVGTRSALFSPVVRPKLIILDEEHDTSFKQEDGFIYQAKEIAHFLTARKGGLLLLGSATPDVKTTYAVEQGNVQRVQLHNRVSDKPLPQVEVVDLTEHPPTGGPLSKPCLSALSKALENGEQVILYQNRRGYAPQVYCPGCGGVASCPECEVGLTYHKGIGKLICHYCGHTAAYPCPCGQCGECRFLPLGEGTEQVEEYLRQAFPKAACLRLDRDSTRKEGELERVLEEFSRRRADILVGTQMLSKGHDFPGVSTVIVVDGDLGLSLPDFRATERFFQMLVQVSGRAGRADFPGRVFIQTRNPDHYCWRYVQQGDYFGFYTKEIERRRRYAYPPFVKLAAVRIQFPSGWDGGQEELARVRELLLRAGRDLGVQVLGPAPAPLRQLRRRLRFQCLLKGERWDAIRGVFSFAQTRIGKKSKFRIELDPDPVSML